MVILKNPLVEIYFPNETDKASELAHTTHLGIGAHQDDLEIFAIHGILEAYDNPDQYFTGVTVMDGRGAPQSGPYVKMSGDELWEIRTEEQKQAARIGKYHAQFFLNYESQFLKSENRHLVVDDIKQLIIETSPSVIYTHNLADKHDTHVAVAMATIQALRELPALQKDITLYGCEVWRGLDWLSDDSKVALNISNHPEVQDALLGVFQSQIMGGKRYDRATIGRRKANATYHHSHRKDTATRLVYAMDLSPLISDPNLDIWDYVNENIYNFANDVRERLYRSGYTKFNEKD